MKFSKVIVSIGLLCVGSMFSAHAAGPVVPLKNDEAMAFIKGNSLNSTAASDGSTVSLEFKDNGTMYGNSGGYSDSGKWRVEGGKLCMEWRRWNYEGCGKLVRVDGVVKHLYPDGERDHLTFQK